MARDVDLLRRLRLFGLEVTEIDGWRTRGADTLDIQAATLHHTGGALHGVQPSLGVCINGRSDLAGPLCNVHGPREESRRVNLVAAGRANHAGVGGWHGVTGNSHTGGDEEEHSGGPNEPLSPLRIERACRTIAAMLYGKADADMAHRHAEWATPKGRKSDIVASLISGDYLRQRVGQLLANPALPWPGDPIPKKDPTMDPIIYLTTEGAVLLQDKMLVLIVEGEGIDREQDVNQWDLRKAPGTWRNIKAAYGNKIIGKG